MDMTPCQFRHLTGLEWRIAEESPLGGAQVHYREPDRNHS